ncbi:PQQ-dependent sugar dehydrogenase [Massilia sp. GCM10020059]|uniref:PQQ-dependent sugar dehydrogenase n=1 Tax=Massilia agrisoli TaxID=2892444 RepID=A0ABS8IM49_9BURK|nr:PQQ-dependent sugar dehydrogenase [Massilia agrisoli]MCC6069524.1 PQQ-dependent sugar dehydrogenase [Massilia agrisoli]
MLTDRARLILLSFAFSLLAACGGSGDDRDDPPPAGTASLAITLAGLPAGVGGPVKVAGPAGFARDLSQTTTLAGLAAGSYTVTAQSVVGGATTYSPALPEQTVALAAGASATVTVNYRAAALALGLREVADVENAVFVTAPEGDPRLFIVDRSGRIRIMRDGRMLTQPFLDISGRISMQGEGGLLSMAFHPQFASNGHFFVYYTDFDRNIVVDRYTISLNRDLASPTSGLQIISIAHQAFTNHYGGLAAFGPDGFLYLGTGDGGGAGDPLRNGQNLTSLLGKMLRLDVNNSSASSRYAIPPSNTYVGMSSRRNEIWASGLRNPWRFAFDTTGLYIADAGQDRREEINIATLSQSALNYGWNIMEGTLCFGAATCNQAALTLPAFEYDHGTNDINGCSIIGGYVYRGKALPELAGRYFYSDFCGGYLKSLQATGAGNGVREHVDWNIPDIGNVVSFGRDADGELYMVASDGRIHKIIRSSPPAG